MSSREMTLSGKLVLPPSSAQVSHANLTALQGNVRHLVMSVISGQKSSESYGILNPDGSLLKMSQGYAQANLEGFLENSFTTFPRWGIVSGGVVGKLTMLEPLISGKGHSLLPTARANERGCYQRDRGIKGKERPTLRGVFRLMAPTPTARDYKDKGNLENVPTNSLLGRVLGKNHGLTLRTAFVEWMMGFRMGKLNRECSETRSSRRKSTPSCKKSQTLSEGAEA